MEIKETLGGDERSWGLWHEHRGSVRRYTLQGRSALIKLSWLKDLKELQQRSSQPANCKCVNHTTIQCFHICYHLMCQLRIILASDILIWGISMA